MRRFLLPLLLLLALSLPIDGAVRGPGWVESGDANNTRRPGTPAAFAVPQFAAVPSDLSPGTIGYVMPGDGSQPCEGQVLIQTAAGPRCIATVAP